MATKPADYPGGGQALNSGQNGFTANNGGGFCGGGDGGKFTYNAGDSSVIQNVLRTSYMMIFEFSAIEFCNPSRSSFIV